LTGKINVAQVLIHAATQIPIPTLDDSATREFHRLVKKQSATSSTLRGVAKIFSSVTADAFG
jgi:hypothetical protein